MLHLIFQDLNSWVDSENKRRHKEGGVLLSKAVVKVLGQTALIEAHVDLHLVATADVDAYTQADWVITERLNELLKVHGRHWDPHSSEIWMPSETVFAPFFTGPYIEASIAQPDYVLLSKALKAPRKNRNLITEYLAKGASPLFFELGKKYGLDLEQFV